jgi:hypothetical protein
MYRPAAQPELKSQLSCDHRKNFFTTTWDFTLEQGIAQKPSA